MTATDFISAQPGDRQAILSAIRSIILAEDKTVTEEVGTMMGKEMLLYKEKGYFKYGLASVKNYMSLHVMPIYMNAPLHAKYQQLLPGAEFQKGCINFRNAGEVPAAIVRQLLADCARIDIAAMLEKRTRSKK